MYALLAFSIFAGLRANLVPGAEPASPPVRGIGAGPHAATSGPRATGADALGAGAAPLASVADHVLLATKLTAKVNQKYQVEPSLAVSGPVEPFGDLDTDHGASDDLQSMETFLEGQVQHSIAIMQEGNGTGMSEDVKASLRVIEGYMKTLNASIHRQHNEDQDEVTKSLELIANCSVQQEEELNSFNSTVVEHRSDHSTCRSQEAGKAEQKELKCKSYHDSRKTNFSNPPTCSLLDVATENAEQLEAFQECMREHAQWIKLWDIYTACDTTTQEHAAQTTHCNERQSTFETSSCLLAVQLGNVCSCRERNAKFYQERRAAVQISETARKAEHEALLRIECLFGVLRSIEANKNASMQTCRAAKFTTSHLSIRYGSVPRAEIDCTSIDTPCDDEWLAREYESQPWFTRAPTSSCDPCAAPTTTTAPQAPPEVARALVVEAGWYVAAAADGKVFVIGRKGGYIYEVDPASESLFRLPNVLPADFVMNHWDSDCCHAHGGKLVCLQLSGEDSVIVDTASRTWSPSMLLSGRAAARNLRVGNKVYAAPYEHRNLVIIDLVDLSTTQLDLGKNLQRMQFAVLGNAIVGLPHRHGTTEALVIDADADSASFVECGSLQHHGWQLGTAVAAGGKVYAPPHFSMKMPIYDSVTKTCTTIPLQTLEGRSGRCQYASTGHIAVGEKAYFFPCESSLSPVEVDPANGDTVTELTSATGESASYACRYPERALSTEGSIYVTCRNAYPNAIMQMNTVSKTWRIISGLASHHYGFRLLGPYVITAPSTSSENDVSIVDTSTGSVRRIPAPVDAPPLYGTGAAVGGKIFFPPYNENGNAVLVVGPDSTGD